MAYSIKKYVAYYFIADFMFLELCTVIINNFTIEKYTLHCVQWFQNFFTEAMENLVRRSSNDMNYLFLMDSTECTIITTESTFSMVLTNAPKYTHDFTNNIILCVYTYIVSSDMDYLPKNIHSDDPWKWEINYHEQHKFAK